MRKQMSQIWQSALKNQWPANIWKVIRIARCVVKNWQLSALIPRFWRK